MRYVRVIVSGQVNPLETSLMNDTVGMAQYQPHL